MKKMTGLVFLTLLFTTSMVWAQESDSDSWNWRIAPYIWAVNIDGTMQIGPVEADMDTSFSDVLSNLDFGASVVIEAGKGANSVHIDYTYLRLSPDASELPSPPFTAGSEIKPKMAIDIFETGYSRSLGNVSLVFGARYINLDMKMTPVLTGPLPIDPGPLRAGPSWWDAFVGVKTHSQISTNWDFDFYGTVGAGESDLPWTLQGMFGRRYSNGNRLGVGVRVWGMDYSENESVINTYAGLDTTFYGLLIGYEFNL